MQNQWKPKQNQKIKYKTNDFFYKTKKPNAKPKKKRIWILGSVGVKNPTHKNRRFQKVLFYAHLVPALSEGLVYGLNGYLYTLKQVITEQTLTRIQPQK